MALTALTQPIRPLAVFQVTVSTEDTSTVVAFRGEADVATLPAVVGALSRVIAEHDGPVIVDLADLAFIDLGTLRAFDRASRWLACQGRPLTIRRPSRMTLRLLGFLGLSDLLQPQGSNSASNC